MSKAFTDEEAAEPPRVVPPRAPLPEGVRNYVTERGLALLHAELVPPPSGPQDVVRFGATVRVEGGEGVRRYQIVGVDEADAARGRIAFVSPLARALLGRSVGDTIRFRAPRGEEELSILGVEYAADPPDQAPGGSGSAT
jgi:transcription elongation factor GreB